ncbi:putative transcription factor-like [Capsicum annuum]|nr:putative transcription factor-like [Capsicum annuum]
MYHMEKIFQELIFDRDIFGGGEVEHPVYIASCNIVCSVSIFAISLLSEDLKSSVVTVVNDGGRGGLFDVSPIQKVVADFDDYEMAGGEEEMMVSVGEPLPRVVFGGAPSLQEATEATSDLKHALKNSSSSLYSKACVVSKTVGTNSVPKHTMQAFRFLNETRAAQPFKNSSTHRKPVRIYVLDSIQIFHNGQASYYNTIFAGASFLDSDHKIDESVADADSFSQSS